MPDELSGARQSCGRTRPTVGIASEDTLRELCCPFGLGCACTRLLGVGRMACGRYELELTLMGRREDSRWVRSPSRLHLPPLSLPLFPTSSHSSSSLGLPIKRDCQRLFGPCSPTYPNLSARLSFARQLAITSFSLRSLRPTLADSSNSPLSLDSPH